MLAPSGLIVVFAALVGRLVASEHPSDETFALAVAVWLAAFACAYAGAIACIVDASRGRVPVRRTGSACSRPPANGRRPRRPAPAAGCVGMVAFMAAYMAWIPLVALGGHERDFAMPIFLLFGIATVLAVAVLGVFFLDAMREGGTHAMLWGVPLTLAWALAAPLYWLLYVRPRARRGGGP